MYQLFEPHSLCRSVMAALADEHAIHLSTVQCEKDEVVLTPEPQFHG